jgi:5-(carboxyamino)imidazole ribonucleotide synthase
MQRGGTIGIFGGGQLGRMLAQSAHKLGFNTHIYDPFPNTPAGRIATHQTSAAYEDEKAIIEFAKACDVITYEFENIPVPALNIASPITPVFPDARALAISHDRLSEKQFLRDQAGVPVVEFFPVETMAALTSAINKIGSPSVLKTRRFGYDGKGQVMLKDMGDARGGYARLGGTDLILENFAPFEREISVIAARAQDGSIAYYPFAENVHKDHRLHTSIAPAPDPHHNAEPTQAIVKNILEALDYVGVIGVEFFELPDGQLVVNEIAPRVHNSGHWTQNADITDQFEQHIRAITGLELGETKPSYTVEMTNLIGDEIKDIDKLAREENTFVHDYDKRGIKPGRKMGHVNRIINP